MQLSKRFQALAPGLISLAALVATTATGDIRHVPSVYPTIQAAIDGSVNGDTVIVANGTYAGPGNRDLDFLGKAITVRSESGAAACVIDCQGSQADPHRGFRFHSGETSASVLDGLTVRNGWMTSGGAVLCESKSAPLFRNCIFSDNSVTPPTGEGGGGMFCVDSSPTLVNCQFLRNRANASFQNGGGGMWNTRSSPTLMDCAFVENRSIGGTQTGGAGMANILGSSPSLTRCHFVLNISDVEGGGIITFDGSPRLTACVFQENRAGYSGGGIMGVGGNPTLIECLFRSNEAEFAAAAVCGAENPTFTRCTFSDNTSGYIGAVIIDECDQGLVEDCYFEGNECTSTPPDPSGGALHVEHSRNILISRCRFRENTSVFGGAVLGWFNVDYTFVNCEFFDNRAIAGPVGASGGAVCDFGSLSARIINCSFAANSSADSGGAVGVVGGASLDLQNCILYGNAAPVGAEICAGLPYIGFSDPVTVTVTYSDVKGGQPGVYVEAGSTLNWGPGNLDASPLFESAADGNLHLTAGSPCVDTGDPALPMPCEHDLDGACRVWDGDSDSVARVDMGAYEFAAPNGDLDGDCQIGLGDLATLLPHFGGPGAREDGDVDGDGVVDLSDLAAVLAAFGTICP